MNIELREVVEADCAFWVALHHVAERATIERQFGPWDEALQDRLALETWKDTEGERRVIVVDGRDAGWWHVKPRGDSLFLNQLILHPDFQNRGIGSRLLKDLMGRAVREGKAVTLQTLLQNTAKGFYEKKGFRVTGRSDIHWLMRWEPGA